jgi:uncharacterized protein
VLGNVRLPVLLVVASSPAAGAGANIGISGVAAATAAGAHIRAGRVDWPLVAWMAPPSILGAFAGATIAGALPDRVLLVAIGCLLLAFGFDLLRPRRERGAVEPGAVPRVWAAVAIGAGVGLIGGLVGLILSTLRVPAMLRWVRMRPARVIGTNLPVGVCVGTAGVAGHLPTGVDWELFVVGAAASVPGALLGARYTGRLDEHRLLQAIGAVLLVSGSVAVGRAIV